MTEPFNEAAPDRDDSPELSGSDGYDCECCEPEADE